MHGSEAIGEPYQIALDLVADNDEVDGSGLLGADVELVLRRGEAHRSIYGIVAGLWSRGTTNSGLQAVGIRVVPALALAAQRIDSRIFQEYSAQENATTVLGDFLGGYGRSFVGRYVHPHEPRDYCVQYRESDLAFARRLMEEDGLFYVFEQPEEGPERMLVLDDNGGLPVLETPDGNGELEIVGDAHELSASEVVTHFAWTTELQSTAITRLDFDPAHPETPIVHELKHEDAQGRAREVYAHDERRWSRDDGAREAELQHDTIRGAQAHGSGSSNAIGVSAGTVFTLRRPEGDVRLVVTRVVHRGDNPEVDIDHAGAAAAPTYVNHFECIPSDVPVRLPRTTPKPRAHGPETATVTGPEGEEIHTDELGRIKVAMHWDRLGKRDETSSCWLRCTQISAGHGFGAMVLPRIGMEVVVDFLAGNPDRPFVSGCLYNGTHSPPYTLPDEKTKTTLRTQSSPGADGFNELTFEDRAGAEQVYVHAQRDLVATARRNETRTIGADQSVHVGHDQSLSIDGDQRVTVKGNQVVTVEGGGESGVAGSEVGIKGELVVRVTAPGKVHIDAAEEIKLTVGGSSITIDQRMISMMAGEKATLLLAANALMGSSESSLLRLSNSAAMRSAAGAAVTLGEKAVMVSAVGSQVLLTENATMKASAGASVKLDASATIDGESITATASPGGAPGASLVLDADAALGGATTTCTGDGGSLTIDATGATLDGTKIGVIAQAIAEITGGTVKINC